MSIARHPPSPPTHTHTRDAVANLRSFHRATKQHSTALGKWQFAHDTRGAAAASAADEGAETAPCHIRERPVGAKQSPRRIELDSRAQDVQQHCALTHVSRVVGAFRRPSALCLNVHPYLQLCQLSPFTFTRTPSRTHEHTRARFLSLRCVCFRFPTAPQERALRFFLVSSNT